MDTLLRFLKTLMVLSVALTGWQLLGDRGGGDWFFTLLGLTIALNLAPYLGSIEAMKRLPVRWGLAVGIAACLFGVVDVGWRMQAFNFATSSRDAGIAAFWVPLGGVAAIPLLALLCYPGIAAISRRSPSEAESRQP